MPELRFHCIFCACFSLPLYSILSFLRGTWAFGLVPLAVVICSLLRTQYRFAWSRSLKVIVVERSITRKSPPPLPLLHSPESTRVEFGSKTGKGNSFAVISNIVYIR